jgi:hypothetical protein
VYVLTVVFGRGPDGVITEQGSVWVLVSKTAPLRLRPVNTVHCPPHLVGRTVSEEALVVNDLAEELGITEASS